MTDYISRELLKKRFCGHCEDYGKCKEPCYDMKLIDNTPAADVRPVKRGKWKRVVDFTGVEAFGIKETMVVGWGCNVCGYEVDVSEGSFNFCPNCGADMREK